MNRTILYLLKGVILFWIGILFLVGEASREDIFKVWKKPAEEYEVK